MAAEVNGISKISDVSYLLTRLRLASRRNEFTVKEAVVQRLRDLGFLREPREGESIHFKNLRDSVNRILGTEEAH
ncbi:MAG: hypothetical protein JRJ38_07960 [Deltaproteobacteria bacterium]|nr:hypothetical protein [Deltaproteobacteria bacterium]